MGSVSFARMYNISLYSLNYIGLSTFHCCGGGVQSFCWGSISPLQRSLEWSQKHSLKRLFQAKLWRFIKGWNLLNPPFAGQKLRPFDKQAISVSESIAEERFKTLPCNARSLLSARLARTSRLDEGIKFSRTYFFCLSVFSFATLFS